MKWWTSDDLADVYARLLDAPIEFVVIGGQAINLWSQHYQAMGRQSPEAWSELQPFASRDLDVLGGRIEAAAAAAALQVEVVLFEPGPRECAPNAGTLYVPIGNDELIIQFLHTPRGALREEIRSTARILEWGTLRLPVMHPVLCLESKLECLYALDQGARQDLRHLRLSLLFVRELIFDHLATGDQRGLLGIIERVAALAADECGLRLWIEQSIAIEDSLRLPAATAGLERPKIAAFLEKRWPQILKRIETRRDRYSALVDAGKKPGARKN